MNSAPDSSSRTQRPLQPGETLGNYQLLCPIAQGGMGQIWAARRTGRFGLPQLVAIKTALPSEGGSVEHMERLFFDEARVAASIDHPNVCKTFELGEDRGILFLAMEWIDGASLANLVAALPNRCLDARIAAYIVAKACAGLHAAHELTDEDGVPLHVVHRDATPQNVLITMAGDVKLVDFGVVKARDQAHHATAAGEVKGKIAYLAPEQLLSKPIDRRTDIFALGCVLYFLSTGTRAFGGENAGAIMLRIVQSHYVKPSMVMPDFPPELEAIVMRAMSKDREERYQTAAEMQAALEEFVAAFGPPIGRETLANLLAEHVGPSIAQRRAEIRNAQRLFDSLRGGPDSQRSIPASLSGVRVAFDSPSSLSSVSLSQSPMQSVSMPAPSIPTKAPPAPMARVLTVAVVVGLVGLGLLAGRLRSTEHAAAGPAVVAAGSEGRPVAVPTAVASSEAVSSSPEDAFVGLTVRAQPSNATLSIDHGPPIAAPLVLKVPRDHQPHLLEVRAPQLPSMSQIVTFEHDQLIVVDLTVKRAEPTAKATPSPQRSGSAAKVVEPKPGAEGDVAPPAAVDKPRGRRPIDDSDPFRE